MIPAPASSAAMPAGWNPEIFGLTADSREAGPGKIFVAVPGSRADGRRFIDDAVTRGAAAVLTDPVTAAGLATNYAVPVVADANPRAWLARTAAKLAGPQPATMAAVTGTNGKTSTASFTRQIWETVGRPAASIGTLGIERADGISAPGGLTTPDPVRLHQSLAELKLAGVDHVVMEASSIGLDQHRLDGVRLEAAAFTNLTQDHLDYHGDMARYLAAKRRLFEQLLEPSGTAVLNADTPEFQAFEQVAKERGAAIVDYGAAGGAIRLVARRPTASGQDLSVEIDGGNYDFLLPLVGEFQAMNALAALGLALATGVAPERAVSALAGLKGVRGRVELVATLANGAPIYVDYAHTPDGLGKVLRALRPHAAGRLVCVFGAGGDRDPTKRAPMGRAVAALADHAIVTDDNPRGEDPAVIRRQVMAGCRDALEIGDRASAIRIAVNQLGFGDALVIAGKGHEQGQEIEGVTLPFDDASVARAAAEALRERR